MENLSEDDLNLAGMSDEELEAAWDFWFELAQATNSSDPPYSHGVFQLIERLEEPAAEPARAGRAHGIHPGEGFGASEFQGIRVSESLDLLQSETRQLLNRGCGHSPGFHVPGDFLDTLHEPLRPSFRPSFGPSLRVSEGDAASFILDVNPAHLVRLEFFPRPPEAICSLQRIHEFGGRLQVLRNRRQLLGVLHEVDPLLLHAPKPAEFPPEFRKLDEVEFQILEEVPFLFSSPKIFLKATSFLGSTNLMPR